MNLQARYHKWHYDRLWKKIKTRRSREIQEYKDRGENAPWKEGEEYLTVRQADALEQHGYKWWAAEHPAPSVEGIIDVTSEVASDKEFSPKFELNQFLEKRAVDTKDKDSLWYESSDSGRFVEEDTHTEHDWRYCQKGHLHHMINGEVVGRTYSHKISKHLSETKRFAVDDSKSLGSTNKVPVHSEYCE